MPQLRPSGSSFAAFSAAKVQKVCEKRGIWALKVTEGGCFFVTFVFFLMGIVPNNHQNSYNNETIIIDCVGLGGAGADGVSSPSRGQTRNSIRSTG